MNAKDIEFLYPVHDTSGNRIHPTALIEKGARLGRFNTIGAGVEIGANVVIGDCNVIENGVRIIGDVKMGDWNTVHNHALLMGNKSLRIGHNCWFGQYIVIDGTGELEIGNGVIAGMYSQIWTHVSKGEQIEGCELLAFRKTVIEDEVWLVGSCIVGSGLTLGRRAIAMIGSVLTKDMEPDSVWAGVPARRTQLNFYRPIDINEKFNLMQGWAEEFCGIWSSPRYSVVEGDKIRITDTQANEHIIIAKDHNVELIESATVLYLDTKTYTKRLSQLERDFLKFLLGNKARFICG